MLPGESVFTFGGRVNITGDGSNLSGNVFVLDGDEDNANGWLTGEVDIDGSVEIMGLPRGVAQDVGIVFIVQDVATPLIHITGAWSVNRTWVGNQQQWSFSFPVQSPNGVFGSPMRTLGNALGLKKIDIAGVYRTPTGIHLVPLITNGVCDNHQRVSSISGTVDTFQGTCASGRYDGIPVSLVLGPGHGLSDDQLVRKMLESIGVTKFAFEAGKPRYKEFAVTNGPPIQTCQSVFDTEFRYLVWRSDDTVVNYRVVPPLGDATVSITEQDILAVDGLEINGPRNPPTRVTAVGSQQMTRDDTDCGLVSSPPKNIDQFADFAPVEEANKQNADFTLVPQTPGPDAREQLHDRTVYTAGYRCGVLIHELTQKYAYLNPESARYQWTTGGTVLVGVPDVYLSPGALIGPDDNSPAHIFQRESFRLVSEVEIWHIYNQFGYETRPGIPSFVATDPMLKAYTKLQISEFSFPVTGPQAGFKLGQITETRGWFNPLAALKTAVDGTPIENVNYINSRYTTGAKGGVYTIRETYGIVQWEILNLAADDLGYLATEDKYTAKYTTYEGTKYWYTSGTFKADEHETFKFSTLEAIQYVPVKESQGYKQITEVSDITGKSIDKSGPKIEDKDGKGPEVPRLSVDENVSVLTPEERENSKEADRRDTQTIQAIVMSSALETRYTRKDLQIIEPNAEDVAELDYDAHTTLIVGSAKDIRITLAAAFHLVNVRTIHARVRNADLDHDLRILAISWSGGGRTTPIKTVLTCAHYLTLA